MSIWFYVSAKGFICGEKSSISGRLFMGKYEAKQLHKEMFGSQRQPFGLGRGHSIRTKANFH